MSEKIPRKALLASFLFMLALVTIILYSTGMRTQEEFERNIAFQSTIMKTFIEKGADPSLVEEVSNAQKQHLKSNADARKRYRFEIVFFSLAVSLIFAYLLFRYSIEKTRLHQKELSDEKKNLEQAREELHYVNEQLTYQLYKDSLTQLDNRFALERDIASMEEPKLILLDIDSFKDINEYYGSAIGDFILQEIASELRGFSEEFHTLVYRSGADEFALLEDANLDIERYEMLATTLVELLKGKKIHAPTMSEPVEITVAIGFSLESEDIYEKASMALDEAKKREIDYICYFKKIERTTRYAEQIKWSKFIQDALLQDAIIPYYQPIFNAQKEVVKHECLVRILNDDEEVIPPGFYLGISKKVKRYADIEKVLIDKSFKEISGTNKIISLNLLARDMSDSNISNYVVERLNYYNVAKQVIFEILEDESIESLERVGIFIDRVKRMGCKIAIDDFGTGYSNFSYLLKLRPDYIKIDGSLIKAIDKDINSMAIVTAIIAFAKKLQIKTIAEYVHNERVYELCLNLGIDEFQGFYLGEPSATLKG